MKTRILILILFASACNASIVANWKLNEKSGTNVRDSVGSNDGTWAGTAGQGITSVPSPSDPKSGLLFDGISDIITIPADAVINDMFLGSGTFTSWINVSGTAGVNTRIFNKSGNLAFFPTGTAEIEFRRMFADGQGRWGITGVPIGSWFHFALVYDSTLATNTPTLYINGVAQTLAVDAPNTGVLVTDAASDLLLGNTSGGVALDGVESDVRIYDTALTAQEIQKIYLSSVDSSNRGRRGRRR